MKILKQILVGAALVTATFAAQAVSMNLADITHTPDSNVALNAEDYTFSQSLTNGLFSNFIAFTFDGTRDLVASISGSAVNQNGIQFTVFDLLGSDKSTVIEHGGFVNVGPRLSFGGLESYGLIGNYFIHVAGVSTGSSQYSGNISLASPVSEAETYSMMLLGLGLMGFIARRRRTN